MPPSDRFPPAAHRCWERVYEYSMRNFTEIDGFGERDAVMSADDAVAGWYTRTGRRRAPFRRWQLARLGSDLITLGAFRAIWTCDPLGTLTRHTFSNPNLPLLWSESKKTAVVFPRLSLIDDGKPASKKADEMMRMWAKGRGARVNLLSPSTPEPMMQGGDVALIVEYFSDKFTHGSGRNYIHHHHAGVRCSASVNRYSNRDPIALALRGGRLRVTSSGIEG